MRNFRLRRVLVSTRSASGVGFVDTSRQYRDGVLAALARGGWSAELEQAALAAGQRLARARRETFTPHVGRAVLATTRTLVFVAAPLVASVSLWKAGWHVAVVPLITLAGIALYGGVAILHDLAHGSFLASRRLNTVFGQMLAPLLLMEFDGFRRSHLDHPLLGGLPS